MKIKGILVKIDNKPVVVEFEDSLDALQHFVGGYIEMIQLTDDEDVDVVINEEGKINGLKVNKYITHNGRLIDVLMGDIVIVGADNETGETISVPENKIKRFIDMFSNDVIEI